MKTQGSRADLHCHSTASQESRLGVQRALGLPECATPPEEVYELAKRRGMDFVTITDHDTIDGVLELADRPDVFVSEELTASFKGEPQQVHVLCYGITPGRPRVAPAQLRRRRGLRRVPPRERHRLRAGPPLLRRGRPARRPPPPPARAAVPGLGDAQRLARPRAQPARRDLHRDPRRDRHRRVGRPRRRRHRADVHRDPARVDPGRVSRAASAPATRAARGDQGSAAKWAHAAMGLAIRALGRGDSAEPPDPRAVLQMVEHVMSQGAAREGALTKELGPEDGRALLDAWLAAMGLDMTAPELLAYMQSDDFSHADLFRRARRIHERRLREAVDRTLEIAAAQGRTTARPPSACSPPASRRSPTRRRPPSSAARRASWWRASPSPCRVALVADGLGGMHGVTHTLDEIRERGVPGFEVEVVGTDANVDRRLSAVAEVDIPFYEGLRIGVPSLPAAVETLAEGRYDLVHLCSPGPAGVAAALIARIMELPIARQLPHRARRLCRPPLRRRAAAGGHGHGARRLLRAVQRGPLAERVGGRVPAGARRPGRAHRALGPRRGHRALRPGAARGGPLPRRRSTCSTPAA